MNKIRKAIIPVTGFGEKHLDATKTIPIELLPIFDRPLIQHVIDEVKNAGINEIIFVTGKNRSSPQNYFKVNGKINDDKLRAAYQLGWASASVMSNPLKTTFAHQPLLGNNEHYILSARDLIGDEPFAVLDPTLLINSNTPCIKQLMIQHEKTGGAILAFEEAHKHNAVGEHSDGFKFLKSGQIRVADKTNQFVRDEFLSNIVLAGRYIFTPSIFDVLEHEKKNGHSSTNLIDAICTLSNTTLVSGHMFEGITFNCNSLNARVTANIFYALEQENANQELVEELIRTKLHSQMGKLLDANASNNIATILQEVSN